MTTPVIPAPAPPLSASPTATSAFAAIDWEQPWLAEWRGVGRGAAALAQRQGTLAALQQLPDSPVRFVAQSALPSGTAYEIFVARQAACPVRDGLHDFFNGLCWQLFPRSKHQLNRLHAQVLEQIASADGAGTTAPPPGQRGRLRDAATLFDENGAVLLAAPAVLHPLWQALQTHDWTRALITLRPLWQQARLLVFGHALQEKLVQPRKNITAHLLALPCPAGPSQQPATAMATSLPLAEVDALLAERLQPDELARKPFTPLPLLGVPGWSADNADKSFYDDASVFRPARHRFNQHNNQDKPVDPEAGPKHGVTA